MSERDPLLDAVLASGVKLPAPSATLLRLQALAADDNAGPGELADAIGQEPALTGEFMRVANSPVFRTRAPARTPTPLPPDACVDGYAWRLVGVGRRRRPCLPRRPGQPRARLRRPRLPGRAGS